MMTVVPVVGGGVELPPSTPWARIATAVTTQHQAMSNAPTPGACGTLMTVNPYSLHPYIDQVGYVGYHG